MYNLNDATIESEGKDIKIFPLGIVENVKIESISVDTSEKSVNPFLKIIFKAEDGSTLNMFEFEVTPKDGEEEAAVIKRMDAQKKRLVHVIKKILPEGTPLPSASSWTELITKIVASCPAPVLKAKSFRLKTVYGYTNYVSLPKYVPFMEDMSVAPEDSRLKIDPKFDKMVKDEASSNAEVAAAAIPAGNGSDLPF